MTSRILTLAFGLLASATLLADDAWFGVPPENKSIPIEVDEVMAAPEQWTGRELLIAGRITDVCTNRGCWAVFEGDGHLLRIMARDHSFALPAEARGPALAHGVLEKVEISPSHARHLVEDDGADAAVLEHSFEYRLISDGVRLRPEA